jgi:hypothetical protein
MIGKCSRKVVHNQTLACGDILCVVKMKKKHEPDPGPFAFEDRSHSYQASSNRQRSSNGTMPPAPFSTSI